MVRRYLVVIIGTSKGIGEDLDGITDDRGINYVDGKGLFLATFYSEMSTTEIHSLLNHRPAFLLFDITEPESNGINLPSKYYLGLFPEFESFTYQEGDTENEVTETKTEEYDSLDDILDKLSRNNYDRTCLTENEVKILTEGNNK